MDQSRSPAKPRSRQRAVAKMSALAHSHRERRPALPASKLGRDLPQPMLTMMLPLGATSKRPPGPTTNVDSRSSTMAGPSKAAPANSA
jgi:hypothetical protein